MGMPPKVFFSEISPFILPRDPIKFLRKFHKVVPLRLRLHQWNSARTFFQTQGLLHIFLRILAKKRAEKSPEFPPRMRRR